MEEYQRIFKSEVLPVIKRINAPVMVARRRLGTDGYDLTFETPMNSFADLDTPPALIRAIGAAPAATLTAKLNSLATVMENTVLVRQPDLSF